MAKIPPMTRRHGEVERRIHAALEDERRKQQAPSDYIRLSGIGKCVRALWAERNGVPDERPPDGRTLMTFDVGHALEDAVIDWLLAAGFSVEARTESGVQSRVVMGDRFGIGHIDGQIRWGRQSARDWRLLEVKTAKAKRFDELLEAGSYAAWSPEYADQVIAYMGASQETLGVRELFDCLVLVLCKDDARIYSEMIRFDPERYAELVEKAKAAIGEKMPDRPKEANGQYSRYCKYCSFAEWCYSGIAGVEFDA